MDLNSCLYELDVMHCRVAPKRHRFTHRIYMFYLDLDELDTLSQKLPLFNRNRRALFEFRDSDHICFGHTGVKENVLAYARGKGVNEPIARVMLMTNVRTAGYVFNPVSFYFCFDPDHRPVCAVAQVGNTFGELKPFFLGLETLHKDTFRSVQKKYYYISPFIDLDVPMDFRLKVPGERLFIRIDDLKKERKFLYTTMTGKRRSLTNTELLRVGFTIPLVTLKVIFLIHWHAAVLHFIKKIPHHKKRENPELQREVLRAYKIH
ncbi:MAG: DUF1365 domain-containing protein [Candidatus Omnitrophica bacterium]|nr:DUF1365 domain-containing protein [Candidatus Omnitrophota bacterium]